MEAWRANWPRRAGLWLTLALLAGVALGAAGVTVAGRAHPAPIVLELPPEPTAEAWRVHVSGAVARPGVVKLAPGSIAADALEAAGGAASGANLEGFNLAQPLVDGAQVRVPRISASGEALPLPGVAPPDTPGLGEGAPLNLNRATADELERLPGIGPSTAAAIIRFREENGPFARKEAIMDVPGIGPAKFAQIEELIAVE